MLFDVNLKNNIFNKIYLLFNFIFCQYNYFHCVVVWSCVGVPAFGCVDDLLLVACMLLVAGCSASPF